MSEISFIYLILPAVVLVLWILSRNLALPPGMEESGISREFLKISLCIYNLAKKRIRSFSGERIRIYLAAMEQRKDLDNAECEYFIRKISIVLMMAVAGSFLAMMMSISAHKSTLINDSGEIERNAFGEKSFNAHLLASDEEGEELVDLTMPVRTRMFTDEEVRELFEEASSVMEEAILGENESLDSVTHDLKLVDSLSGYPFDISWKMDNYEIMHFDGELNEEEIPGDGETVTLTAVYTYEKLKFEQIISCFIMPRPLTEKERISKEIEELLLKTDEETLEKKVIPLPESYNGKKIIWTEKVQDNSMLLLALILVGAAASYVMKDKELKESMEQRRTQLLFDYPQFVSELLLYMGAGMTVRNILRKQADAYAVERENGARKRYLYEEVQRAVRELAMGTSEADVYEHMGMRCGIQQYTRLFTLLSQNLRKGNSDLMSLLSEESKKAFEERMDKVRKAGEEAGTKLLLPMVIMLVIVMVIIMIPAYLAF